MSNKPSHGPLIAILGGTALAAIGACGGGVFLFARGLRSVEQQLEARRGPTEVLDDDYRVRLTIPDDGEARWELWDAELASGWDPAGVALLRNDDCAAGLLVTPRARTRTVREEIASDPALEITETSAPRGTTGGALSFVSETGAHTIAYEHAGSLYRILGTDPCTGAMRDAIEMLPGQVRPRRITPPVQDALGPRERVRERIYESAATGLVLDGHEPFAIDLEHWSRQELGAEVVLHHVNGASVALETFREGTAPATDAEAPDAIVVPLLGQDVRFVRDEVSTYWVGHARQSGLGVWLWAMGPDREAIAEALRDLSPRVSILEPEALARLRAELPAPHERRATRTWSLRDGVFREHPEVPRPAAVLTLPAWMESAANEALTMRGQELVEGQVVSFERRDVGVSARLSVRPTEAPDAREVLALRATYEGLATVSEPPTGDATEARTAVALDAGTPLARRVELLVAVREGWAFTLEAWTSVDDEASRAVIDAWLDGLSFESPPDSTLEQTAPRVTDRRLGFALDGGAGTVSSVDLEAENVITGVLAQTTSPEMTVVAFVCERSASCRNEALDALDVGRNPSSILSHEPHETMLDDRPAIEWVLEDVSGFETHLVHVRLDRTTYLVALRGGPRTDWVRALARLDLDP